MDPSLSKNIVKSKLMLAEQVSWDSSFFSSWTDSLDVLADSVMGFWKNDKKIIKYGMVRNKTLADVTLAFSKGTTDRVDTYKIFLHYPPPYKKVKLS